MEPPKLGCDQEWIIQISRALEEGLDDNDEDVPVSIFRVPKTLISVKPETYTPQLVALGPYHRQRLELLEMEHYKLASAKKVQKNLQRIKFRDLVDNIAESDSIIPLATTGSWSSTKKHSHGYCPSMLPSCWSVSKPTLPKRKTRLCESLLRWLISSTTRGGQPEECFERAHLLELLYSMVAPNLELVVDCEPEKPKEDGERGWFEEALKSTLTALCYINLAPLRLLSKICKSKAVQLLITLPVSIISFLLNLKNKGAINNLILSAEKVAEEAESASHEIKDERPLVEEIAIPSVTELHKLGVKFRPTKGGLRTINFDKSSGTFFLPVVHLDDNSEVVLRNLVAYEACIAPDVMVFTRYTELMNGIIDTKEDVRMLREAGIVLNRLKSDQEVATLWNGMTKSVTVTKVPILDKAIEGANAYYSKSWKVKMNAIVKKYVFGSWPCLTFLAANVLIMLSAADAACSVYNCSKWVPSSL
ncbi:hypothetical protein CJ030_MR8G012732 [Morella rubra]|uniref:Uncharacterized protein n=1 Tax=Morella rubra TaxID=262757 RepID=A0A6A1V005_9ROSI|nr:hypothetical protein CJ030_MR8G012732 [Morella rubra]